MITMHCPSCGAECRIPKDKVETRLVCKKCFNSFHLTKTGKVLVGGPNEGVRQTYHASPGHEFDHVDEEIDLVLAKARSIVRKGGVAAGVLAVAAAAWFVFWSSRPLPHDQQALEIVRAFVRSDLASLQEMATSGSQKAIEQLSASLRPELLAYTVEPPAVPAIELVRRTNSMASGISEVVASVRADQVIGRMGITLPDVSLNGNAVSVVEIPLVLLGSDRFGWRLDADRTLEAFQQTRSGGLAKLGNQKPSSR